MISSKDRVDHDQLKTEIKEQPRSRMSRNTTIFSVATGLSRVAGLFREVIAASFFGTSGPMSAFTTASNFPNLIRSLFADAALSAAFVPVFTELLEQKRRREAATLATTLLVIIIGILGSLTLVAILVANVVFPLFTGPKFTPELDALMVGFSRVMMPIVLLLAINGLVVGILNAYDHFSVPALSPLLWNAVILVFLVGGELFLSGNDRLYAYAVGIVVGTFAQLIVTLPMLPRVGFHFSRTINLKDPRIKKIFVLMLPVTVSLGLINFDVFFNMFVASRISDQAPRAIESAFRIYMLPQGMFSVALATVLFPALSRYAVRRDLDGLRGLTASGVRQIFLLLIPAAAITVVLSEPIIRVVFARGQFNATSIDLTSTALFWFSFSLPFAGVNLLLTRAFFSLQLPWLPTQVSAVSLVVNIVVSLLLYKPFGIAGVVFGTVIGSLVMTAGQVVLLRRELHYQLEGVQTGKALLLMCVGGIFLVVVAYTSWWGLDSMLGRSLFAQIFSVGTAIITGFAVYAGLMLIFDLPEAHMVERYVEGFIAKFKQSRKATDSNL